MTNTILSLLLSLQLLLAGTSSGMVAANVPVQENRLLWGLIDPELSSWFARLPLDTAEEEETIRWDFSWRGFLAALFGNPLLKEEHRDGTQA